MQGRFHLAGGQDGVQGQDKKAERSGLDPCADRSSGKPYREGPRTDAEVIRNGKRLSRRNPEAEPQDIEAGFFALDEFLAQNGQDIQVGPLCSKTPTLYWTSVFVLRRAGCPHVYRIISVAPCPIVGSFTTESPARINLLITSKQTGILWLGFGYPPTSLWRFSDSIST